MGGDHNCVHFQEGKIWPGVAVTALNTGLSQTGLDVNSFTFSRTYPNFRLLFKPADGCAQIISLKPV